MCVRDPASVTADPQPVDGAGRAAAPRPRIPTPRGVTIRGGEAGAPTGSHPYRTGDDGLGPLTIVRRWYSHAVMVALLLCVSVDYGLLSALSSWCQALLGAVVRRDLGSCAARLLLVVGYPAIGVSLTYSVLTGLFNRTTVTVTGAELVVRHGPVPPLSLRNQRVPVRELQRLYVEPVETRGAMGDPHRSYALKALLTNGLVVDLLTDLAHADGALFFEQRIKARLGMRDEAGAFQAHGDQQVGVV